MKAHESKMRVYYNPNERRGKVPKRKMSDFVTGSSLKWT